MKTSHIRMTKSRLRQYIHRMPDKALTVAAPFTCTDLHAVVVGVEGSLSTLWVSLCFSATLGSL